MKNTSAADRFVQTCEINSVGSILTRKKTLSSADCAEKRKIVVGRFVVGTDNLRIDNIKGVTLNLQFTGQTKKIIEVTVHA